MPDPDSKPGFDLSSDQVKPFLRERWVQRHYRANLTPAQCLRSLFMLHNETFDIWSHGTAAIFFWAVLCFLPFSDLAAVSRLPAAIFCASKASVFSCSFAAHTFRCINAPLHELLWRLDWSAISLAILGSAVLDARLQHKHRTPQQSLSHASCFLQSQTQQDSKHSTRRSRRLLLCCRCRSA